jgi:hypothetical protein
LVQNGAACEEEDFSIYVAGLPLEAAAEKLNASPHAAELRDRPETAACLAALAAAAEAAAASSSSSSLSPALAARLRFRHDWVKALSLLRGKRAADLAAAAQALQAVVQEHVPRMRATATEGEEEGEGEEGQVPLGFDANRNSHLTPPSPPRQLKVCVLLGVLCARERETCAALSTRRGEREREERERRETQAD